MRLLFPLFAFLVCGSLFASDVVVVPGTSAAYGTAIEAPIGGKTIKMNLTGTAVRTKVIINVYAVGSYIDSAVSVKTAEELASVDAAKRLHLILERSIDGKDLAEAFRTAIRVNYPEPSFNDEVNMLVQYMRSTSVRKGEQIFLTHVPGVGLHLSVAGKADFVIRNVKFSQAVWDIYLGKKNLGDAVKKGLTSRL
jgi:3-hydroxyisobutyrate dehydrogenase-like beta-hydroxyacid dehydrogenase